MLRSGLRSMNMRNICTASILLLAIKACRNEPTLPVPNDLVTLPSRPVTDLVTYEHIGTYTIPSPPDSSTPMAGVSLPGFAAKTLLRATITGSVTTSLTPFNHGESGQPTIPGAPRTFGPTGYYYYTGRLTLGVTAAALPVVSWTTAASAQSRQESKDAGVRERCERVARSLGARLTTEDVKLLRDLRDCDRSSGPLLARYWTSTGEKTSAFLTALIGASSDVRDSRTAMAARAVVQDEARPIAERAAALTVLANYIDASYVGHVEQTGEKITVGLARRSHTPTSIPGSSAVDAQERQAIVSLAIALRSRETKRELREIAQMLVFGSNK